MLGLPIGIFLSSTISGWLIQNYGWRSAFYVAIVPGILCAVAALLIHEPARGSSEHDGSPSATPKARPQRPGSPYLLVLGTPTIVWIVVSGALHNFNMYATNSFLPGLIKLRHGLSDRNAGLTAGIVLGAVGVIGMLGGGWMADVMQRLRSNGRLIVASTAMFLSAPLVYLGLDQPHGSIAAFMIFTGAGVMFMYVYYASVYAAIQDVIEPGLRGTAMALYFFAMYVVGGAFGPKVTGKVADVLARRAMVEAGVSASTFPVPDQFREIGLHQAFYIVPALCAGLGIVLFAASRTVASDMRKLTDWYEQAEREPTLEPTIVAGEVVAGG
jgi:MFS family permease